MSVSNVGFDNDGERGHERNVLAADGAADVRGREVPQVRGERRQRRVLGLTSAFQTMNTICAAWKPPSVTPYTLR